MIGGHKYCKKFKEYNVCRGREILKKSAIKCKYCIFCTYWKNFYCLYHFKFACGHETCENWELHEIEFCELGDEK